MDLASYIDHTMLKAEATSGQVEVLCQQAVQYRFASVCINPSYVQFCRDILSKENIAVCTVVGFPLGANLTVIKAFEAENAIRDGATEIDMVMNIGAFKDKRFEYVLDDIKKVKKICGNIILKVIIETVYLDDQEKVDACFICRDAGADFVKTSTGFAPTGATIEDVKLLKKTIGNSLKIKAAGGIRNRATAEAMIKAGADRLGTSSSVAIIEG
jgi:deoxyribose-phosphate aldolase